MWTNNEINILTLNKYSQYLPFYKVNNPEIIERKETKEINSAINKDNFLARFLLVTSWRDKKI